MSLLFAISLATAPARFASHSDAWPDTTHWGYAPEWIDLKRDADGRRVWLRLQRNAESNVTESKLYTAGRLVRNNTFQFNALLLPGHGVARIGNAWMVFSEWNYGAGSTWHVSCDLIDRRTYKLLAYGNFEHGDWSEFQRTHRFIEYRYLKYQELHRDMLDTHPFQKFIWRWDTKRRRFTYVGGCFSTKMSGLPGKEWSDDEKPKRDDVTGGDASSYTIAGIKRLGFPPKTRVQLSQELGVLLYIGNDVVARFPLSLGDIEIKSPPRVVRTADGVALTYAVFEHDHVRRYDLRIQRNPYKIKLLGSRVEKEWTPFSH